MKTSTLLWIAAAGVAAFLIYRKVAATMPAAGFTLQGLTDTQGGSGFTFGDNT